METRFSQRLSLLMKKRKISGQRLGAAVGKSQKTISRYANGEIDPGVEMKNAIYRAIADISGNEEDAMTEAQLDEQEFFWELSKEMMENPECAEVQMGLEMAEEREEKERNLIHTFQMLSLGAKEYYLENFEAFHKVETWENKILEFFHGLPSGKQEELIKYLENFNFDYKVLTNADKLASYMKMLTNSKKRPVLIMDKDKETKSLSKKEKSLQEAFEHKLYEISVGTMQEEIPYYPWFLSYSPQDWYFLLRVQIFELYDKSTCMWDSEFGIELGVKLAHLLDAMK